MRENSFKAIFIFVLQICISCPTWADDLPGASVLDSISAPDNYYQMEKIELRRGDVSFYYEGPKIPGPNNLSISLGWSYKITKFQLGDMGTRWNLEIPAIVGASNCSSPLSTFYAIQDKTGPLLALPGQDAKQLLTNSGSPFTGVKYVTNDNWTATCVGPGLADWLVKSPTGLTYQFYHTPAGNNASLNGNCNQFPSLGNGCDDNIYVTKILDLYGNWVQYNYNVGNYTLSGSSVLPNGTTEILSLLQNIKRSDGATITINYKTYSGDGRSWPNVPPDYIYTSPGTYTGPLVSSITENGKTWTFNYDGCYSNMTSPYGTPTNYCDPFLIKSFSRPDGQLYSFIYSGYFTTHAAKGKHGGGTYNFTPVVQSLTTPSGMTQSYNYNWNKVNVDPSFAASGAVLSKTYSGPGVTPTTWTYVSYVNPPFTGAGSFTTTYTCPPGVTVANTNSYCTEYFLNGTPYTGGQYSYTFVMGPTKMQVNKYLLYSFVNGWQTQTVASPTAGWNRNMLVETGVYPLPPAGTIPTAPPVTEPIPPAPEPISAPVVTPGALAATYYADTPLSIDFTDTSTLPIVWAQCSLNGAAYVPCTGLDSDSFTKLSSGTYTLTIETEDAFGNWSAPKTVTFRVVPKT